MNVKLVDASRNQKVKLLNIFVKLLGILKSHMYDG
jgi:hypothetical protein